MAQAQTQASKLANPVGVLALLAFSVVFAVAVLAVGKLAVVGLVGALAFVLFAYFPVIGVYATTAALLLQGSTGILTAVTQDTVIALTVGQLLGLTALAAWLCHVLVTKAKVELNWPTLLLGAFCLWMLAGTLLSPGFDEQWGHWLRVASRFAFFVLAVNTLNKGRNLHFYIWVLVSCGVAMSLAAVVQYFLPQLQVAGAAAWQGMGAGEGDLAFIDQESLSGEAAVRVSGRAGHSNWLALVILMLLPLNIYLFRTTFDKRIKTFAVFSIIVMSMALILTFTRTGFLIGAVLLLLLVIKGIAKITPLRLFGVLLIIAVSWVLLPSAYKERVLDPGQYVKSRSVQSRLDLQTAALDYTVQNPVFGLGAGGFGVQFIQENSFTAEIMKLFVWRFGLQPVFIGTHNMYLQITSDAGLFGLFLFLLFYIVMLRQLASAEKSYRAEGDEAGEILSGTLAISLVGFMGCALFLHALHQQIWWMHAASGVVVAHYHLRFGDIRWRGYGARPGSVPAPQQPTQDSAAV